MDEEQIEQTSPPINKKLKVIKAMTLALVFIAVFTALGYVGVEKTSSSEFCSSCHEMKPQYYTWKASSHSEVDCVSCHIQPGVDNYAKAKANGLVEVYKKQTDTYVAPIRMPKEIPDAACERCHNIDTRRFTVSGDLIIPHDKHKTEGVKCVQCHSGTAHGKVSDRKMAYKSDYQKWDEQVGTSAMKDTKFIKPDMDTCMECHRARKVTTECSACHTTGMFPDSHKMPDFKVKSHGLQASYELEECHVCHKDMSKDELEGFEEASPLTKVLSKNSGDKLQKPKKTHYNYAKENTYCSDCHKTRPESHTGDFMNNHGEQAEGNTQKCFTCHAKNSSSKVITDDPVPCSSCHPSSHKRNQDWRMRHPIEVSPGTKVNKTCYSCHVQSRCSACHKTD